MLATYMWRLRNNNLEIRIEGTSCRPQLFANSLTTAITFSRQNDAGSPASTTEY